MDKNEKPINKFNISIKINNMVYKVKTDKDGYFEYVFKATKSGIFFFTLAINVWVKS
ncbi:MAG: hypothetical protein IJJ11_04410 [Methanosphaera sp.]|nr:hypothetical protein [Methanosphaera sp.]